MVDKVNQAMEVPELYARVLTPTGCLDMVLARPWMDRWE